MTRTALRRRPRPRPAGGLLLVSLASSSRCVASAAASLPEGLVLPRAAAAAEADARPAARARRDPHAPSEGDGARDYEAIDYGNRNLEWEDGPSSWEEFGHDNDPAVCGVPRITVREWEEGRFWEGNRPYIVTNVTEGWAANNNWRLSEMLKRYPDAEATMGDGRRVGETGPDSAGNLLEPTTVEEFITKHMYDPFKYFFDRKIAIPNGMLEDCHPFPMPTRMFIDDPHAGEIYAPSKKERVNPKHPAERWQDHLAISIGADLQGLSFHFHGEAWNAVIFGKKRWILYDNARWKHDVRRQRYMALEAPDAGIRASPDWIRTLYHDPERKREIRNHGHDCIQHAGEMMFVPRQWLHMVVNIGNTVSVISEVGFEKGQGKTEEDFSYDPFEPSGDSGDEEGGEELPRGGRPRR
ncbi:hypothetical protein ACHAWF_004245 [Thalassiosira exigua]